MHGPPCLELGRLGYDAWGVDPSRYGIQFLTEQGGRGYIGTVLDEAFPLDSIDAAISFHVFEHLKDPYATIRRLHELLTPGGVLHFSVPHWGGLVARQMRTRWKWFAYPQHLHYYSKDALPGAIERMGFDLVEVYSTSAPHESDECFDAYNVPKAARTNPARKAILTMLREGLLGESIGITAVKR